MRVVQVGLRDHDPIQKDIENDSNHDWTEPIRHDRK